MNNSPGKIFVSYERGLLENQSVKRFSTFNFGRFQNTFKQPLGNLYLVNDDVLYASKQTSLQAAFPSLLVTLPITGKIHTALNGQNKAELDVEQVRVDFLRTGDTLTVENPYTAEWINYLQFGIKVPEPALPQKAGISHFDIHTKPNELVNLFGLQNALPCSMHMGLYNGRKESVYAFEKDHAMLFAFVVSGAFELQCRLLHQRDSLALWDIKQIELEALSNDALIVLLEMDAPV